MNFVCLWSPAWQTAAASSARSAAVRAERDLEVQEAQKVQLVRLAAILLTSAPRVTVDARGMIWADARGLNARVLACALLELMRDDGVTDARAGVASTPVAAELAAVRGQPGVTVVEPGDDPAYVGLFPVDALEVPPRVRPLLFGIGVKTCSELATLAREAVEVRLGAEAVTLWRRARADDDRAAKLFAPMPRELPHATLDWMDYEVTDPARLLFVINALLENVCDALTGTGQGARELAIEFSLTNRTTHVETLRASRATASRQTWMRLVRSALDRMKLPASVTGIALRATRVTGREERQSDLFDRGLATADATDDVVTRLMEDQGNVVVVPYNSAHPLLEARTTWRVAERPTASYKVQMAPGKPHLTLQLAPVPQPVVVETVVRRDHFAPARFRDATGWHEIVNAAGPDRVSGGRWDGERRYAREYFRCVTREGALVWLFRAAQGKQGSWYLHGWWD
jgi:protein ImuB